MVTIIISSTVTIFGGVEAALGLAIDPVEMSRECIACASRMLGVIAAGVKLDLQMNSLKNQTVLRVLTVTFSASCRFSEDGILELNRNFVLALFEGDNYGIS